MRSLIPYLYTFGMGWVANREVYGAHKLWIAARKAGHDVDRDQVARLMRAMAIEGVSRQREAPRVVARSDRLVCPRLGGHPVAQGDTLECPFRRCDDVAPLVLGS